MRCYHLERRDITLRTLSPVFIGAGERLTKKEYLFDRKKGLIHFIDFPRLIRFLKERGLLSKYEEFLSQPRLNDFQAFLLGNRVLEKDYPAFVSYTIAAGEAAHEPNFREVLTFIKDAQGLPYIPGSSLKGAIRTALAARLLNKGEWDRDRQAIERAHSRNARHYLADESKNLEKRIFHRLQIKNPKNGETVPGPINDIMQGIRVSDSASLSCDKLVLAGKYDRKSDGTVNILPIFRECLMPGSEAHMTITLDLPVLAQAGLDIKGLEDALHEFADKHYAAYEQYFEMEEDAPVAAREGVDIILGGGAGYVSKTLTYNLYPRREQALPLAAKIMTTQFPRHGHHKDAGIYKTSPHTLKTTRYNGQFYQMGRCEVIMQ